MPEDGGSPVLGACLACDTTHAPLGGHLPQQRQQLRRAVALVDVVPQAASVEAAQCGREDGPRHLPHQVPDGVHVALPAADVLGDQFGRRVPVAVQEGVDGRGAAEAVLARRLAAQTERQLDAVRAVRAEPEVDDHRPPLAPHAPAHHVVRLDVVDDDAGAVYDDDRLDQLRDQPQPFAPVEGAQRVAGRQTRATLLEQPREVGRLKRRRVADELGDERVLEELRVLVEECDAVQFGRDAAVVQPSEHAALHKPGRCLAARFVQQFDDHVQQRAATCLTTRYCSCRDLKSPSCRSTAKNRHAQPRVSMEPTAVSFSVTGVSPTGSLRKIKPQALPTGDDSFLDLMVE